MHDRHRTGLMRSAGVTEPARPASAPRILTVFALVGARAVYRAAAYGAGLGLLALWEPADFARYAAAMGATGWLMALAASGPEKAALVLLPRPGGAALERFFLLLAIGPFTLLLIGWFALAVIDPAGPQTRLAAAVALTCGLGCCAVQVSLYRVRGRPYADPAAFLAVAAAYGLLVALAATVGLTLPAAFTVLIAAITLINVVLLRGLVVPAPQSRGPQSRGPQPRGPRPRASRPRASRPQWTAALRAAGVLGVGEVLGTASISVLYLAFAVVGHDRQTSLFYILFTGSALLSVGWVYLLRIAQPQLVGWLTRAGAPAGRRLARRVIGATLGVGIPAAAMLAGAAALGAPHHPLALLAVGLEVTLFASTTTAIVVSESIDAHGRRWSAIAALSHFLTVAATGWLLVPAAGALGAFGALIVGELIRSAVSWHGVGEPANQRPVTCADRSAAGGSQ